MIAVRFLRPHSPYNAGEVAGVPEDHVERLVEAGIVERLKPAEPPAAAPPIVDAPPADRMVAPGPGRRGPVRK